MDKTLFDDLKQSLREAAEIRYVQSRFEALCQRIQIGFSAVPKDEGMAKIDAAVAEERRQPRIGKAPTR